MAIGFAASARKPMNQKKIEVYEMIKSGFIARGLSIVTIATIGGVLFHVFTVPPDTWDQNWFWMVVIITTHLAMNAVDGATTGAIIGCIAWVIIEVIGKLSGQFPNQT